MKKDDKIIVPSVYGCILPKNAELIYKLENDFVNLILYYKIDLIDLLDYYYNNKFILSSIFDFFLINIENIENKLKSLIRKEKIDRVRG